MTDRGADSALFEQVIREFLEQGMDVLFQARGASMSPAIRDGEVVQVTPVIVRKLRKDDIVLTKSKNGFRLHRVVIADHERDLFITRGDCGRESDPAVSGKKIVGIVVAKEVRVGRRIVRAKFRGAAGMVLRCAARGQRILQKVFAGVGGALPGPEVAAGTGRQARVIFPVVLGLLLGLLCATRSIAQVAVDSTSFTTAQVTGSGTSPITFTHTTAATANELLIVGVSINLTHSTGTTVTSVTYNGTALTLLGAHNDAGLSRRVEMWSLLAPASGTFNVVVNVNVPTALATVGVVTGATTFTGVDQTLPLGTFVSADGAAANCVASANPTSSCNSQLDVPSVVNGMVMDVLATGEAPTVTTKNPQVQQWNTTSGGGGNRDPNGTSSTRTGAPSVPVSELFSATSNWSQGAVSINPSTADIAVTTSVATVMVGSNTTYNITVTNNGPSAANSVQLVDTLASGMTLVSATPTGGATCSGTGPITCNLAALTSGSSFSVAVVETASTSGAYANTAVVSDSGTPTDPNTGNNSYTAVATVQTAACAAVSQAAPGGTLTGTINTYYPGTASVAPGAKSIPIGTAAGAGNAIVVGNLLLVIQMQDATINVANNGTYGNGSTGQGFTALNSAGDYEFVTATSASSGGGSVSIAGSGSGGGLVFAYHASTVSATAGQSTYQVIVVPQYTSATLSSGLIASPWNGTTGGVLALDISGTLTLNSATVAVDGDGFRGGAGLQLGGGGGANTDYLQAAPATYTPAGAPPPQTTTQVGEHAAKGEGIAGTPAWVESGGTFLATGTGYPSGTAGVDGSMARGAPANGGGGGTDADPAPAPPAGNDQNAGGGGGGNGGAGGFGGDSWFSSLSLGGEGGTAFPATVTRVAMGGGGGAGTRNNSNPDTQASGGSTGGGIIIIRTYALSGTATLTANGLNAYNGTANDAGGGGGAGGSIVVLSATGGESGLTLNANGGTGGDAWATQAYTLGNRHGPGGGGGGGVVFVSGPPASISVVGAASGTTENPGVTYGSTAGVNGVQVTNASISSTSGTLSGAQCTPDMTLAKSHVGNFTRGSTASYTVPVSNVSPFGASNGLVTVNDNLPLGITPTSATGTGWACAVAAQTVSCTRSDVLPGASSYPSITVNANVSPSAPPTVTNTAIVGGGGEINLTNDTATDVAVVVSSADLGVTNVASPNPVTAGGKITYTQVVTNNGPSAADNATLVDTVPANAAVVSIAAPAGWSCITPGGPGNVVCTNSNMAGSTSGTFTLVMQVASGLASGTVITQTASVSSSASDPNLSNNTATATTVVGTTAQAELTVTNVAAPNPVAAGTNITYTQVVTNTGAAATTTASFTEGTPTNTTFFSVTPPAGWSCTAPPVNCTNTTGVAAGSSATFSVLYTVNAGTASGTSISDTATVNAGNQAFGANSSVATDVVAGAGQADLVLTTAATPATVLAGNNVTYTQTVTNNGPAAASSVSFTETEPTPADTTFQSVSAPAGWVCTTPAVGAPGTVTCTDASMAAGTSADIVVVVNVAPTIAAGTFTTTSSVSASNSVNTSTTTTTTAVNDVCDLTVTNTGSPNPVTAGATLTYTQTVTNNGPSNCSTATFNEANPNNTTFASVAAVTTGGGTWTCPNTGPVGCTNPSVPPGSTVTITAKYTVSGTATAGTIITDTATAASVTKDSNLNDNTATVNIAVTVAADADLSMTESASPNPVTAGNNITYTQTVKNLGPASAGSNTTGSITVTETLPAGATLGSLTPPAGWSCSLVTLKCTNNANTPLASGASLTFTFVVGVPTGTGTGTTITDTVSVVDTTPTDPNPNNNMASASVQVGDSADLQVTDSASPVPGAAGANVVYTQVVTNAGPSTATSVTLTDTLPANTTVVTLTGPAGWTCTAATKTCTNPSFAPGSATIVFTVAVTAGTPAGTVINSTATVSSTTSDPNPANNTATANDVVAAAGQADLSMANTPSASSVAAGSTVTYTQVITNLGPAATTAGTATLTQNVPANMTFQSMTPPAGWTCPAPVGGTITCTANAGTSIALNGTASFTLMMQVNAGTISGTSIPDTATASAGNVVPGLTTNSATATVLVANANSADMAIVKTATPPNVVSQGDNLTYTLTVTNNGPASATNVTVQDMLPTAVTYVLATTTAGTCSESGGRVTCLLGTMANAGTATVSILTVAGTPGVVLNTATVQADQTDPNPANNTSTYQETIAAQTSIQLQSFLAWPGTDKNGANRALLTWKTGGEANNLGFNVYRELNGNRVRLNPSLIAGSALWMSGALPKHSGKSYNWIDPYSYPHAGSAAAYWLEDVDVDGTRTMHGPVLVEDGANASSGYQTAEESNTAQALMLNQLNQAQPPSGVGSHPVETLPGGSSPTPSQIRKQFDLAAYPAVKILVTHEGWYSVRQPDLVKAGLDPNVDPAFLQLFAEAIEQPIQITGATGGYGGFGPQASINFYGTGIDTQYSGTRVYWLVAGRRPGQRIPQLQTSSGANLPAVSFRYTVEVQPRIIYFAALLTPDGNNFFGALVSPTPVEQVMQTPNLDVSSTRPATIDVALQGIIAGIPHDVSVAVNGTVLGDLNFTGQQKGKFHANLPPGLLQEGNNTVTLTAQNGEYDTSLVSDIRVSYPHLYSADSDQLEFVGHAGDEVAVGGFTSGTITLLDITDPVQPVQLSPQIVASNSTYSFSAQVPWTTTAKGAPLRHTLLAIAADQVATAAGVRANHPSSWHSAQIGAEVTMVSHEDFVDALPALVAAHKAGGKSSVVVPIGDLYDEFNFGERSPDAIRQFLQTAAQNWRIKPKYLLLNGRASVDPRNYLGFGHLDYVPTKIVAATGLMTASDDWFSDFNHTGMPTIATGRLPVSTLDEANTVVAKIAAYQGQSTNGTWTGNALFVADHNDANNFTQDSQNVQSELPPTLQVTDVFTGTTGGSDEKAQIVSAINSGQLLVNYIGHGSEEEWSGEDIFDNNAVATLTNGSELPVFFIMDCLNGLFQDVYDQPLAVTLMLAPNGGGVAILASSGLNQAPPQAKLDALVVNSIVSSSPPTLGDAILSAKSQISSTDVRKTYILFGDPAMQVKTPGASAAGH